MAKTKANKKYIKVRDDIPTWIEVDANITESEIKKLKSKYKPKSIKEEIGDLSSLRSKTSRPRVDQDDIYMSDIIRTMALR